jgi:hypothetical protein
MAEGAGEPRLEDFGITEEDLSRTPCLFLAGHRAAVLATAYLTAAGVAFALMVSGSGSYTAAALFTIIVLAAASILLLPVLTLAQCASEQAEERWLCRRFPKLRACLAYRKAVAEYARKARSAPAFDPVSAEWWASASPTAFVEAARLAIERHPQAAAVPVDRERSGVDFVVDGADGVVLVRCEPGRTPVAAAVGRELAAALEDHGAARAVLVTAAGPTPALSDYIAERSITVVAPWELSKTVGG